ncbi:MAG TPA: flagellar export protein FliJ [Janthinobacterium sp.]|nr:flagellar export protein FliJ [Janthinobacterium sp.]
MNENGAKDSLATLVQLRDTEVERLRGDMAAQTALRERYRNNLERLSGLCADSGASGALPLAQSLNCGQYKQALMVIADTHRVDLGLHEAGMAVSQRALNAAWARREALDQVLSQKQRAAATEQQRRDGKRHDELATELWLRGQFK